MRAALRLCNLCGTAVSRDRNLVWEKDGFSIVRCPSCSLLFRFDLPSIDDLGEIYASDYFTNAGGADVGGYADYVGDEQMHRTNARRRLGLIEQHVAPGRLIDVGCAVGFFVDEAARRGWSAEGIDVSSEMVRIGQTRFGLAIQQGTFAEIERGHAGLDALTMWDYIEHTIDPTAELRKASVLVKPGGVLGLTTGDAGSFVARASGRRWHLLTPRHHNYFFSRKTLAAYLDKSGFDVVSASRPSSLYSVGHVAYKLRAMLGISSIKPFERHLQNAALGRAAIPMNLYDIVLLIAKKREQKL